MLEEQVRYLDLLISHADENDVVSDTHSLGIPEGVMRRFGELRYVDNYLSGCGIRQEGRDALSEYKESSKQQAEEKTEKRKQENRGFVRDIIVAVTAALITLLVEHIGDVAGMVRNILRIGQP